MSKTKKNRELIEEFSTAEIGEDTAAAAIRDALRYRTQLFGRKYCLEQPATKEDIAATVKEMKHPYYMAIIQDLGPNPDEGRIENAELKIPTAIGREIVRHDRLRDYSDIVNPVIKQKEKDLNRGIVVKVRSLGSGSDLWVSFEDLGSLPNEEDLFGDLAQ